MAASDWTVGGMLDILRHGPVIWAAWEEDAALISRRLRALARASGADADAGADIEAIRAVHILDLSEHPLFGPGVRADGSAGLYSARPEALDGFQALEEAAEALKPRLIIVDPLLSAYASEPNAPAPVREFLGAVRGLARRNKCGALALAHSTKEARKGADPYDPGQIGGTAAWRDGIRGALVMDFPEADDLADPDRALRRVSIYKANLGPDKLSMPIAPVRQGGQNDSQWIVGFRAAPDATWKSRREAERARSGNATEIDPNYLD